MDKKFNYKKKFGQNFIYDINFLNSLLDSFKLEEDSVIVEIGAGLGTLTSALASRYKQVLSYEIDKDLIEPLNSLKNVYSNLEFVFKDILKENVKDIEARLNNEEFYVIANLPYYITSPIIFKFLLESSFLKKMFVMVQLEVGERFSASPHSKEYGASTVILNSLADCKIVKLVKRNMFTPMPKVDSCVLEITINKEKFNLEESSSFIDFVQNSFKMKRKTLYNNLISAGFNKEVVINTIVSLGLDLKVRPEELEVKDFVKLYNLLK